MKISDLKVCRLKIFFVSMIIAVSYAGKDKKLEVAGFNVLPYVANDGRQVTGVNLLRRF
jgi:hypothetical protein